MRYCVHKKREEKIIKLCDSISECAKAIKLCDKLLKDHRGRRHTKVGKNAATLWEIYAVIKLRTGQTTRNPLRKDYETTVEPNNNIIVKDKKTGETWSATNDEITNLEIREFGGVEVPEFNKAANKVFKLIPGASNLTSSSVGYNSYIENQNKARILPTIGKIVGVISAIATVVATLAAIRKDIGPAKETVDELSSGLKSVSGKLTNIVSKLKNVIKEKSKAKLKNETMVKNMVKTNIPNYNLKALPGPTVKYRYPGISN